MHITIEERKQKKRVFRMSVPPWLSDTTYQKKKKKGPIHVLKSLYKNHIMRERAPLLSVSIHGRLTRHPHFA
jgi:hypothetical protein